MSILENIKNDQVQHRKAKSPAVIINILTLAYSEALMVGKNDNGRDTTDAETASVLKKLIKGIEDCMAVEKDEEKLSNLSIEKDTLAKFLPKQLTGEEINAIIQTLKAEDDFALPKVMKHFKDNFAGLYDGKQLSQLVKEAL